MILFGGLALAAPVFQGLRARGPLADQPNCFSKFFLLNSVDENVTTFSRNSAPWTKTSRRFRGRNISRKILDIFRTIYLFVAFTFLNIRRTGVQRELYDITSLNVCFCDTCDTSEYSIF